MAILTVSRQIASLGDEICKAVAERLGYTFFGRKDVEKRIIQLGFPMEKFKKFDERKPSFFASLSKGRDEYLDYLQTAILEFASKNNCILIGRGSFIILKDIPNHLSCRFISDNTVRMNRLKREFGFDDKAAMKRINESDSNRAGFHKSFFNFDIRDPSLYHFVINTGLFDIDTVTNMICAGIEKIVSAEREKEGMDAVNELFIGQRIVNMLVFDYKMNINFLRATIDGKTITLHGLAESSAVVERALIIASCEIPEYKVESAINVVQDFKAYGQ